MNPEREILNYWFNRKGFLTVNNEKVGQNKELYLIAVKIEDGAAKECIHVEAQISVSASGIDAGPNEVKKIVKKKFEDSLISKQMKKLLSKYSLKDYRKAVVLGAVPKNRKEQITASFTEHGVEVIEFSDVLTDSLKSLDGQMYQNHTVRTLQLLKFLMIIDSENLTKLLNKLLQKQSRRKFLESFLDENAQLLVSDRFADIIGDIIKSALLKKPTKLAEYLSVNMTPKSYDKLVLKLSKVEPNKKSKKSAEQSLSSFFSLEA